MPELKGSDDRDCSSSQTVLVKDLSLSDYEPVWQQMTSFTNERDSECQDQIWLVEHAPVYTLGQAGKEAHLIKPNDIPVVKVDRGGQVTYHGPGQLVCYPLLNIKRLKLGVRELVQLMAKSVQNTLAHWQIDSQYDDDAPGVYVDGSKISSLGLRIRRGCSFHGLSLNIDMDLKPFDDINPCGYPGLNVIQMKDFFSGDSMPSMNEIKQRWLDEFCQLLNVKYQFKND